MFSFFEVPPRNRAISLDGGWRSVKNVMRNDMNRVDRFRKESKDDAYLGNHLIEDLILTLNLPPTETNQQYVSNATDANPNVSRALYLTHATGPGRVHYGKFYNNLSNEIIMTNEAPFDIDEAVENWRDIAPVTVVEHPYSDYTYLTPNGIYGVNKEALVVITINVPMLALQHKLWVEQESMNTDGTHKPIRMYIAKYVLTNMTRSHMDIVSWNRFKNSCMAKDNDINHHRPELPLTDVLRRLDRSNITKASILMRAKIPMNELPQYIPMVFEDNLYSYMSFEDFSRTRYTNWAIGISRLSKMMFLVDFFNQYNSESRPNWLNPLLRDLLRLSNDNTFRQYLPRHVYMAVITKMKELVAMAKGG